MYNTICYIMLFFLKKSENICCRNLNLLFLNIITENLSQNYFFNVIINHYFLSYLKNALNQGEL